MRDRVDDDSFDTFLIHVSSKVVGNKRARQCDRSYVYELLRALSPQSSARRVFFHHVYLGFNIIGDDNQSSVTVDGREKMPKKCPSPACDCDVIDG
jgi:hypothetical protein